MSEHECPTARPICPECHAGLQPEGDVYWCSPCGRHVSFPEAIFETDDDDEP